MMDPVITSRELQAELLLVQAVASISLIQARHLKDSASTTLDLIAVAPGKIVYPYVCVGADAHMVLTQINAYSGTKTATSPALPMKLFCSLLQSGART